MLEHPEHLELRERQEPLVNQALMVKRENRDPKDLLGSLVRPDNVVKTEQMASLASRVPPVSQGEWDLADRPVKPVPLVQRVNPVSQDRPDNQGHLVQTVSLDWLETEEPQGLLDQRELMGSLGLAGLRGLRAR
jgi:hypothetical protein